MSNNITASIEFYFKGEKFSASVEMELDQPMQTAGKIPAFSPLLANAMNIDVYSYEYEMMQAEEVFFSDAEDLAADYVNEGIFDAGAFETAWLENKIHENLQDIVQRTLAIDDLHQQPELKAALLEAYRLGESVKYRKADD